MDHLFIKSQSLVLVQHTHKQYRMFQKVKQKHSVSVLIIVNLGALQFCFNVCFLLSLYICIFP